MTVVDWLTYWASRITCQFGYHALACRGRTDHDPAIGHWTSRW